MRVGVRHGLALILLLLGGCGGADARRGRQAMEAVQIMGADLKARGAQASDRFTRRPDFEELRRAFGEDRFDAGTPLGPGFQTTLAAMVEDLRAGLEKEPKDAYFLRKAVRRVRHFHQWWMFSRQELEARRDRMIKEAPDPPAPNLRGGRSLRSDTLTVLDEVIPVIRDFEEACLRCARRLEELLAAS